MKRNIPILFLSFILLFNVATAQTALELHETARTFMQQRDYANAVLVLNRAKELAPDNIDIAKDLSFSYFLQGDNDKALEIMKPLLDREDADDQCYQIAGNIYKELALPKECDKLFRKGIKKFPNSGALYNELGELLLAQQNAEAIKQWEKGIETDPSYSKNYYNASKFYYLQSNRVWSILYGEIFINMEPMSGNAPEIKSLLLENYKQLFATGKIVVSETDRSNFATAFANTMEKQNSLAMNGITVDVLAMIRSRFILDWFYGNTSNKMPFKLFELHRQLLQDGLFDAYNQWVFGSVQNLAAYQNWTSTHSGENEEFLKLIKGRIFKMPQGQYYK